MPSSKCAAALPLAILLCVLTVDGVAATPAVAAGESLPVAAPQGPSAVETSLALDRATRRLIQQGLRNEGFDPGTPDGLFGPRTRAAIRDWQQSRGAPPTGYLNRAEAELLRTAAPPPAPEAPSRPPAVPAVDPSASSAATAPAATPVETDSSPASPAIVATEEVDPQNAATEPNTQQRPDAGGGDGTVQLPPEILIDRHLVRAERLLGDGDPVAALEAMTEILALQEEHDLVLQDDFNFQYAQVAYAAGRTETATASLNQYLAAGGREAEFYREALELLDSAEVRSERDAAERTRLARWPPGELFRDCAACPEMVILPGSALALGRYELTVGEYRAFASATAGDAGGHCVTFVTGESYSWRDPSFPQTDHHPVTCLSWNDVQAYLSWLSGEAGTPYRLPSEDEWTRAAAGSPPGCYAEHSDGGTCAVGSYRSNNVGLFDMVGNVSEFTSDCYDGDCRRRVTRGGNWWYEPENLRPDVRGSITADIRSHRVGFRVARTLK